MDKEEGEEQKKELHESQEMPIIKEEEPNGCFGVASHMIVVLLTLWEVLKACLGTER